MKSNLALLSTSCGWGWILAFIFSGLPFFSRELHKDLSSYVWKWRKDLTSSPWWSPSLLSFHLFLGVPVETGSPCSSGIASALVCWWCPLDPFSVVRGLTMVTLCNPPLPPPYLLLSKICSHDCPGSGSPVLREERNLSSSCCTSVHPVRTWTVSPKGSSC